MSNPRPLAHPVPARPVAPPAVATDATAVAAVPALPHSRRLAYLNLFAIQFAATLLAVLIGGAVLLAGLRLYVQWSVREWADGVNQRMKDANSPQPRSIPTGRRAFG